MIDGKETVFVCITDTDTITVFDNEETAVKFCDYHYGKSFYYEAPIYSKFLIGDEMKGADDGRNAD